MLRRTASLLIPLALALLPMNGLASEAQAETKPSTDAKTHKTLEGEYNWGGRTTGPLKAVFTSTGDNAYDVDFHFEFRGDKNVWSGNAEGELGKGELTGTVYSDGRSRTFIFSGAFADGAFEGTHTETTGGSKRETGTLTLE